MGPRRTGRKRGAEGGGGGFASTGREEAVVTNKVPKKGALDPGRPAAGKRQYFLVKSEVDVFSVDDMARASATGPTYDEPWDGVRNHQAKNVQRSMREGDLAFFWGSNTKEPGIFGVVEVTREAFPDESQFQRSSKYYDAGATREKPRWFNVAVRLRKKLERPVLLKDLKVHQKAALERMPLFTQSRLSVQPVPDACWDFICGEMNRDELGEFLGDKD
jgi:predicted RNA-binding protein with PUA-like domain